MGVYMKKEMMYVGSYTNGNSEGIYCFDYNIKSGICNSRRLAANIENPSYLIFSKECDLAFAVSELQSFQGSNGGAAAVFSRDQITGQLELLGMEPTLGKDPCHLCVDSETNFLYVANYSQGTFNCFALQKSEGEDCSVHKILVLQDTVTHLGKGSNLDRQEQAHVHYTCISPDEKYLWVVDLGMDQVLLYTINNALFSKEPTSSIKMTDGYGPRHLVFHPTLPMVYIVQELTSRIVAILLDKDGKPGNVIQDISILSRETMANKNTSAAIKIDHEGTYIYASNRGEDNIAVLAVLEDGKLESVQWMPCDGKNPRDIGISPDNRFLFCANQDSDSITGFSIEKSGKLTRRKELDLSISSPTCIQFTY